MSNVNDNTECEVGYKKPPKAGQFKPGQSGNPSGKAKASPYGNDLFQVAMHELVPVQEGGKTIHLTRKHLGVRKRVEESAKGNMPALRELLKLGNTPEGGEHTERPMIFSLDEARAIGWPLEDILNEPNTVIVRQLKPATVQGDADGAVGHCTTGKGPVRRKRRKRSEPRSQSFSALIDFELARRVRIMDRASGQLKSMTMREVIHVQLANAFALGKKGAQSLALRLNAHSTKSGPDRKFYVRVPWDYVVPPKPEIPWAQRRELAIRRSASET